MRLVHSLTKGVPRRINLLCDRALLGAYVENQPQVTRTILRKAAAEVFAGAEAPTGGQAVRARWPLVAAGVAGGVVISALAWQLAARDVRPVVANAQAAVPAAVAAARNASQQGQPAPAAVAVATQPEPPQADNAAALRELAGMWGLTLVDGDPCASAARANLRCLQTKGGIDELRQLDRPAMLKLHDDPVAANYVLLTALDDKQATIMAAGGKPQTVSVDALSARLDGEFTTFWRAPRSWRDELRAGDHGPDVDWLAKRLSQIYDLKKPLENQPLDAALRQRLVEFQTAQNLKADGVAGPKTFIRLYQLGGVQEPRLRD
jgi:general secretion pathway protein A